MSFFLAIGCGQKEKIKLAEQKSVTVQKPVQLQNQPKRPDYAIKAPDFTLKTIQGELFKLSENKGKVILLNFWGTWCRPCRREIPDFNKLIKKYQKDGLEIVGITLKRSSYETDSSIADFMNDWYINYTILTDINNYETQVVTANYGQAIGQQHHSPNDLVRYDSKNTTPVIEMELDDHTWVSGLCFHWEFL